MGSWRRGLLALAAVPLLLTLSGCGPSPWTARLVTTGAGGSGPANGSSSTPVLSSDGTKVAFVSGASNLGPVDTNGTADVYVRDLRSGEVVLVSANAAGTSGANQYSSDPVFSPDGTKVAFVSMGSDLGAIDTNRGADVYVRDLVAGTTTLVSARPDGTAPTGGNSFVRSVARSDGTLIAFSSTANDIVGNDPSRAADESDVFVHDLRTGATTLVSIDATGARSGNRDTWSASLSPDGTRVAFSSAASDLVGVDTNQAQDVFVRDLVTGTTSLVSVNATGDDSGDGTSADPVMGPDGRQIGFNSVASDLTVEADGDNAFDVFVRDIVTGTLTVVSADPAGSAASPGSAFMDGFTGDGRGVVFGGDVSGLGPADTNGTTDIYHRDLVTGQTTLVSVNAAGTSGGNGASSRASASATGTVTFESSATDLGPADTVACLRIVSPNLPPIRESCTDVYVRDLVAGTTTLVSARADGNDSGASDSLRPVISRDGERVYFSSYAADLGVADTNGVADVYEAVLAPCRDASGRPVRCSAP